MRTWNSRRRVALGSSRRITTTTTTITIIATQESELVPVLFPPFGNKKVFSLFFVCVKRNHLCVPNGGFVNGIMAFFPSLFALCYAQLYWPKQKKWFQRRDDDGWCSSKLFTFYMFVERLTILALSASFIQMSYRVVCHYRSELLLRVKKCSSHLDIFWFIGVLMLWMGRQKSKLLKVCSICYSIRNFPQWKFHSVVGLCTTHFT